MHCSIMICWLLFTCLYINCFITILLLYHMWIYRAIYHNMKHKLYLHFTSDSTCVRFSKRLFSAFIVSIWSRRSLILLSISSKRRCKHKVSFHVNKTQRIRFTENALFEYIISVKITVKDYTKKSMYIICENKEKVIKRNQLQRNVTCKIHILYREIVIHSLTFRFLRPTSRRYDCDNRRPLKEKHVFLCNLFFATKEICHSKIYIYSLG